MTRKPDDWMPLHLGAYFADTTNLTRDQHGAYLLLIMAYWRKGEALPADDGQLAAMAKASPSEWRKIKPIVAPFFIIADGKWKQKRCEEELEKARAVMAAKSKAGKAGAKSRWHNDGNTTGIGNGTVMADASNSQCQPDAPLPSTLVPVSVETKVSTGGAAAGEVGSKPAWWPTRDRYGRVTSEVTEKIMFDLGKAVLGNSAGGQVTRMRKAYKGDMRAVIDFLLQADEKSSPSQWFAACLNRAERDQHDEPKHSIFPAETHH
jgi:uncharacterized protein YdaU (DUF1376 family)